MASADSKYLKTLYVLIKDTLNSLSVSWKNLDEKSEATYKIWKDENGVRLYRIITNCLISMDKAIQYLQFTEKYLDSLITIVEEYENIKFDDFSTVQRSSENLNSYETKRNTIDNIKEWLSKVNPHYNGDVFSPYSNNCGSCAITVFKKLNGEKLHEASRNTYSIEEMNQLTGKVQTPMTPQQIHDYLVSQGAGSHAVIGIDRSGNVPGHWFNAYYDGMEVYVIDGQTNTVSVWPPDEDNIINWDMSI